MPLFYCLFPVLDHCFQFWTTVSSFGPKEKRRYSFLFLFKFNTHYNTFNTHTRNTYTILRRRHYDEEGNESRHHFI